jgi:hypothetical protein
MFIYTSYILDDDLWVRFFFLKKKQDFIKRNAGLLKKKLSEAFTSVDSFGRCEK